MNHSFLLSEFYFNGQSLLDCPVNEIKINTIGHLHVYKLSIINPLIKNKEFYFDFEVIGEYSFIYLN